MRAEAAKALASAQTEAKAQGFSLVVYDCYRPVRAVVSFVDWSHNADQETKPARASGTKSKVAGDARAHRDALVALMKRHGFLNYRREWRHYAFKGAGEAQAHDEEVK